MNFENHPCFSAKAHHKFGRVHLPVAPRCNIQCRFCNRKFDCVNESRPGVTSGVLYPHQAMIYLEEVLRQKPNISVVGIAGPGDPFANPEETMETLKRVRETHPEMMLCVATNGLNLVPYVPDLAELNVSHVTVTINAVDPLVGAKIYSWVRYNKRVLPAGKGAEILLEKQIESVVRLKENGVTVKVNSIIIPGVNDHHIEAVARRMGKLDVDILNCIPYYQNEGSVFADIESPSKEQVEAVRKKAGRYVKQMRHCKRCRADAVGLLGDAPDAKLMRRLQACESIPAPAPVRRKKRKKPLVAVASMEGVLVNQHLGEASNLLIYGKKDGVITLLEARKTPAPGGGYQRWTQLADTLSDCGALLVSGIGENPRRTLVSRGMDIIEVEGVIEEAVHAVFEGRSLSHLIKRERSACGVGCTGTGGGCG